MGKKKRSNKKKKQNKKLYISISIIVILALAAVSGFVITNFLSGITNKTTFIYVYPYSTKDSVVSSIEQEIGKNKAREFKLLASTFGYTPKTGAYMIDKSTNLLKLYRRLKNGNQSPVRFTFNNMRVLNDLTNSIDDQLMLSKSQIDSLFADKEMLSRYGFSQETLPSMFIPDTYEVYWNISPQKFIEKMNAAYNRFWNDERKGKAAALGLTPTEATTLASIVEEETKDKDEMKIVAGLYLNRLNNDMLLQADPTVKFALQDFGIKRILRDQTLYDSPYNTYKYTGLPPGPIRIPSQTAIDAVLNRTQHNYVYMCAKEDFSGRHNFATTFAEHTRNAERYRKALNQRNILK